jgi:hypothetical protein
LKRDRRLIGRSPPDGILSGSPKQGFVPRKQEYRDQKTVDRALSWPCTKSASPSSVLGSEMEIAERYRRYAANCLKIAEQIRDQTIKGSLLDMAQVWVKLAEQAERDQQIKK